MNTTIKVYSRSVYGVDRLYIADPDMARAISTLTGSKTLEVRHCDALEALGFTFEHVIDPAVAARSRYGSTLV